MIYNSYYFLIKPILVLILTSLLVSCTLFPTPISQPTPLLDFDTAMRRLARQLLVQVPKSQSKVTQHSPIVIVIDPFIDANTGKMVTFNQQIEQILVEESQNHFNHVTIVPFTPQNLRNANYMINGIIDIDKKNDYHRITISIVDLKTGNLIADSKGVISKVALLSMPTTTQSQEMTENEAKQEVENNMLAWEKLPRREYYMTLDTEALSKEAEQAYEEQNYQKSLLLFDLIAQRPDGKVMKTYAGLYQNYLKLKNKTAAGKAFNQLLAVSVKQNNKLNIKFLFLPNSTEFFDDKELREEYDFWLQQISDYFKNNNQCFQIIGHSTSTENKNNRQLSLLRAQKIQDLMATHFPHIKLKSTTVGKGFSENQVGSNTNDVIDTIDRRVEIVVVTCS